MNEDIHNILGRYFNGQVSPEEEQLVKAWAGESDENRSELRLLEKLWTGAGTDSPVVFDTAAAWTRVDSKLNTAHKKSGAIRLPMYKIAVGIAASLLIILGIWWVAGLNKGIETVVASADVQELKLQDGSKVFLRKGSTLSYPESFSGSERRVTLSGEAFFDVAHNPEKPFIISASETEIKVLGTSFSVNTLENKVELIVKTGRVQFSVPGKKDVWIVSAGERASFSNGAVEKEINQDQNFNAWQTRELRFDKTPLEDVAAAIGHYYNIRLVIKNEDRQQLSEDRVTASFKDQALASVLNELSLITSYEIRKLNETTYEIGIK